MSVTAVLLRLFKPIVLWVLAILTAVEVIAVVAILSVGPIKFSFWLVVFGAAAKYWPLVAGILLVSMYFRLFASNGITRHEFLRGLAVFWLGIIFVVAALVVLGHAAESVVLGLLDQRGDGYPVFRFGEAASEFFHVLPGTAGYLTSGILIAAGFYRFRPWTGVLLIIPGAVPAGVAEGLIKIDEFGHLTQRLPLAIALTISLAATVAGGLATHRLMRDVAIRRATG
ncbi:hypothetical protein [Paractinoplanes maris]|uniref:hypothetical protein n=1 Tax=Paractinoplanes maris TaxID=1734446 RepID=UPI002021B2CA|nr:hypothetical protein [Actinoplanes maris]